MIQSVLKMVLRRQLICKASLNKQMALGNVGKSYVKLHWFTEFSQKIVEETPKVWNWHSGRSRNGQFLCSNFVCCANALVCWTFSPALVARAPGTGSALALLLSQEKRVTEVWNEFRWYQYIFISTYICLGHQCDYKKNYKDPSDSMTLWAVHAPLPIATFLVWPRSIPLCRRCCKQRRNCSPGKKTIKMSQSYVITCNYHIPLINLMWRELAEIQRGIHFKVAAKEEAWWFPKYIQRRPMTGWSWPCGLLWLRHVLTGHLSLSSSPGNRRNCLTCSRCILYRYIAPCVQSDNQIHQNAAKIIEQ